MHWRLAGAALDVAGASQGPLWASLGSRRGRSERHWNPAGAASGVAGARRQRSGRRWCLTGAACDVSGTSQGPLWASRGPRRRRSGRRWGLAEAALGVAGASQEMLWASLGPRECLTSIQRSISLQCLFWVSTLSFTSMLHLGLNAFLHFNA